MGDWRWGAVRVWGTVCGWECLGGVDPLLAPRTAYIPLAAATAVGAFRALLAEPCHSAGQRRTVLTAWHLVSPVLHVAGLPWGRVPLGSTRVLGLSSRAQRSS